MYTYVYNQESRIPPKIVGPFKSAELAKQDADSQGIGSLVEVVEMIPPKKAVRKRKKAV